MEVELMAYPQYPDEVVASAYRCCHDERPPHVIMKDEPYYDTDIAARRIRAAKKVGHMSVLEHASFTFSVSGVSRALTHQLVRHRIASYSQQSQRYVKLDEPTYVTPPSISSLAAIQSPGNSDMSRVGSLFYYAMCDAWKAYNNLIDEGVSPEDARFVLPNACTTNIVVTMNARELLHFFKLRTSDAAQWEIRELARRMLALCLEVSPIIFEGVIEAE